MDPARIGLVGRSYSGFAVLSCVARLSEVNWAARQSGAGPSNLVTFTQSQPPGWRLQVAILVGDADADAEFLVIQGANDPRVPMHESDEGHFFGRRENQVKARSAAGEFLRAHLS